MHDGAWMHNTADVQDNKVLSLISQVKANISRSVFCPFNEA